MAEDRRLRRYNPGILRPESLAEDVRRELQQVRNVIGALVDGFGEIAYEEPDYKETAQTLYADGTEYDPGKGEGFYYYNANGDLVKFVSKPSDLAQEGATDGQAILWSSAAQSWEVATLPESGIDGTPGADDRVAIWSNSTVVEGFLVTISTSTPTGGVDGDIWFEV